MTLYINYKDCQIFFHIFLFMKKIWKNISGFPPAREWE